MQRKTPADWTPERVKRLWTYWNTKPHLISENFSFQVGTGLVNFLAATGRLQGEVLDYGCGLGYLLEQLLKRGLNCSAVEFSPESVALVNQKFHDYPNWRGAKLVDGLPTPFAPASFDVITCTETLEHVPDELLPAIVDETYRLLKPGGIVFFTTPNEENLEYAMTYCPFCDAEFHKVQHLRAFSPSSLRELLVDRGLEVLFCQGIDLTEFQKGYTLRAISKVNPELLIRWLGNRKDRYLDKFFPRSFPQGRDFRRRAISGPHLCAIATR